MESVSLALSTIPALPRVHGGESRKNFLIKDYEHSRLPSTKLGL